MTPRQPRLYDRPYLDWLKERHCVACGKPPPCDPAHIRESAHFLAKHMTGLGRKPDDRWSVPLCRSCHDSQHAAGDESKWWKERGLEPFGLADWFYQSFGGTGGKPRPQRKVKPRKPREQRAKINGRSSFR